MQRAESTTQGSVSLLARERRAHEAFARTRRRAYVEKRHALDAIDHHVMEAPPRPLLVSGPSGSGKSALLARWSARFGESTPEIPIISHFVGNGVIGVETSSMLRHLMLDMVDRFMIGEAITTANRLIPDQFLSWLPRLRGRPVVFLVDGVNHLEDDSLRNDPLCWIPEQLPSGVRVIISSPEGPILEEAERRSWEIVTMQPLETEEKWQVARSFLDADKNASPHRRALVDDLLEHKRSGNPLFLRTSLDELRFPEHDREERAPQHREADDLETLFDNILQRVEDEFGLRLVSTALRLIDASRNGLSAEELAGLCGVRSGRIERLLARLDFQLVDHDGLHTFFHDHFRRAVTERYIPSKRSRRAAARKLGSWFRKQSIGRRRAFEEMCAWMKGEYPEELQESLTNIPLLHYLWSHDLRNDVIRYWNLVGKEEGAVDIAATYRPALNELEKEPGRSAEEVLACYTTVIMLGFAFNQHAGMEEIIRSGIAWGEREAGTSPLLQQLRRFLGVGLREQGMWEESDQVLHDALRQARASDGERSREVGEIYASLALTQARRENHEEAIDLYCRSHEILRRTLGEDHPDTIHVLIDLLAGYQHLGVEEEEEKIYHDLLERARLRLGEESRMVARLLHNRGVSLQSRGDLPEARRLIAEALAITRKVFGQQHPNALYHLLGLTTIERTLGNVEASEKGLQEAFDLVRLSYPDDHPDVLRVMNHLEHLRTKQGDHEDAEELYREVLDTVSTIFGEEDPTTTIVALNLATILTHRGQQEAARPYFERYMPLAEKIPDLRKEEGGGSYEF